MAPSPCSSTEHVRQRRLIQEYDGRWLKPYELDYVPMQRSTGDYGRSFIERLENELKSDEVVSSMTEGESSVRPILSQSHGPTQLGYPTVERSNAQATRRSPTNLGDRNGTVKSVRGDDRHTQPKLHTKKRSFFGRIRGRGPG